MRHALLVVSGLILTAFATNPLASAEKRVALVIGNGTYVNATPLPNPRNDAEDVADALERTGFETIVGIDLDQTKMQEATIEFARAAREADVALFYYSGHAMQFSGVNYLMPVDAKLKDEADLRRMARVDDIIADLQQAKNLRILVLDACRDNPLAEQLKRSVGLTRAANLQRGLARIDTPQGMIVAFSTQAQQTADDGQGRNSPYTAAFLKHIETQDEIGRVFRRISTDVYEATQRRQLPELSLSMIGEYYLWGEPPLGTAAQPAPIAPLTDAEQERQAGYRYLARQLDKAKLDRAALAAFLKLCGSECPDSLRESAEKKINQVSVEATNYRAAESDPGKLRAYIADCQLCQFRSEATARLENIEAEQSRLRQHLDRAGYDKAELLSFLRNCTATCPADLRSSAQTRLAEIEKKGNEERERNNAIEAEPVLWVIEYKSNGKKPIIGQIRQVDRNSWIETRSGLKLRKVDSPGATDQFVDETSSTRFRVDILAKRIFKGVDKGGWVYFADVISMKGYRRAAAANSGKAGSH
jgi:hypothetical protein